VNGIFAQQGNTLYVNRTDINHAVEIYSVDITTGSLSPVTRVNDEAYKIRKCAP
jgi:hypothetical protein